MISIDISRRKIQLTRIDMYRIFNVTTASFWLLGRLFEMNSIPVDSGRVFLVWTTSRCLKHSIFSRRGTRRIVFDFLLGFPIRRMQKKCFWCSETGDNLDAICTWMWTTGWFRWFFELLQLSTIHRTRWVLTPTESDRISVQFHLSVPFIPACFICVHSCGMSRCKYFSWAPCKFAKWMLIFNKAIPGVGHMEILRLSLSAVRFLFLFPHAS